MFWQTCILQLHGEVGGGKQPGGQLVNFAFLKIQSLFFGAMVLCHKCISIATVFPRK